MNAHILPLSDLHRAAPGVLDRIFGPDGTFEGAPNWAGPVMVEGETRPLFVLAVSQHLGQPMLHVLRYGRGRLSGMQCLDGLVLDLRVPSVAARLAGLCARALRFTERSTIGPWRWSAHPGAAEFGTWGCFERWTPAGTLLLPHELAADLTGLPPTLPLYALESREAFLAALVLALGPRIAALGLADREEP